MLATGNVGYQLKASAAAASYQHEDYEAEPGEPEPGPARERRRPTPAMRCGASITAQLGREYAAYWQLCQLAAELASMTSPWSATAPFFVALAEQLRVAAGSLVDLLLRQGESVELPELSKPLGGLAGAAAEVSLHSALESAIQLLDATERHAFSSTVARDGDGEAKRLAEDLYLDYRRARSTLYVHLSVVDALRNDLGATLQYAHGAMK